MARVRPKQISLARFAAGTARLSPDYCRFVAAACALKFQQHGHAQPAKLSVNGISDETFHVKWEKPDPRTGQSIGEKATEFAGECIGIALCEKLTEFNVVERSYIGTGFDFWLGKKKDPLFQRKARLELSGIDEGGPAEVEARVRKKESQLKAGSGSKAGGALIVISEFQRPVAKVVRHA